MVLLGLINIQSIFQRTHYNFDTITSYSLCAYLCVKIKNSEKIYYLDV